MVWDAWPFTLTATVTNPPAVDDFAVKVIVAYQTGMRSDFADLRFSKDGVALSHTIWSYTASTEAEVWVKIPSGTTSFTLHYGNASAEDASDPDNTFLFCDRFTGFISGHWKHIYRGQSDSSAIINANNELEIRPPTNKTPGSMRGLVSKATFSKGIVVEYSDKLTGDTFYPGITIGTGNLVDFNGASTRWDRCAQETGYSVVTTNTQYSNDGTYLQRNLSSGAVIIQVGGPGYDPVDTFSIKRFIWAANNYLAFENSGTVVVSGTDSTWQSLPWVELVIYQGWYGGNGGTRVIEWIRVRPYQATEPTVVLSASTTHEELAGTIEAISDTSSDLEISAAPSGTLTLYPVEDSYHEHRVNNSTLETLIAAAGTGGARTNTSSWACNLETAADTQTSKFLVLARGIFSFDTSALPDNATITGATLKMVRSGGNNLLGDFEICLVGASPADPTKHNVTGTNNDYSNVGSTEFASRVAFSDWAYLAQHTFTLNAAGRAAINKSGYTSFAVRIGWDVDGSFTGTWGAEKWSELQVFTVNDATQANWPVLEITYTTGVTHELAGTIEATAGTEGATTRLRSAGGAIAISATVGAPMLVRLRGISGAPGAVSVSAGYLQALLDLYGAAISVQVGLSGVITRLRSLIGSAPGTGVLNGALQATNLISGAIPCTASISGLLKATLPVTALTVSATSSCSGQIQVIANLYGAIPANAATTESLLRATTPLTGITLPAQASVGGDLQVEAWLSGAIAATSGTNGSVAAPVPLSGAVALSSGVSGALQATVPIAGTVAVNSGASVTATRLRSVVGGVAADSGCMGVCVAYVALRATVAAVGRGSALLAAPVPLQALVPALSGSATSVTRMRSLSVSVPAVSGGTGIFFAQMDIVGTVPGTGSVAGTLQAMTPLAGVPLAAVTGATGTVIRLRGVVGRVETVGAATGHLEATNQITGTIHAVSSGIGNLHAPVPLTGKIHEVSGAAGIVHSGRVAVLVPGTSAGTGVMVASPITRLRSCSGVTRGRSTVNGDLAPVVPLFADLVVSSGTLADLTVGQEILLSGDTSATSLLSASLNAVISLNGALNTEGKVTGLIAYVASLTGSVLEVSGVIGDLAGPKPLYGAINSGSSINGEIYAARSVNGTISCESSVNGNLTAIVPLNIECTVTGGLNGVLAVPQVERLTGAFPATGSCTGSLTVTVRLETAIVSISEIFGDLKSGVAFSSEVTPVSSVTGELSLGKAVELVGSISAVSINSGITNTRRSLTCEGAAASTTVSVWLSRAIPITCVVSGASWGQANIDHLAPLSGTIAAYSGIQGSLGVRSIRAATSYMEACVASTIREAICVRETVGYAVPITAKVSYTFSFTVTSSTRKIVAKTVYRAVSNRYKEEYRVFALPDDLNVGEEELDCYVVVTKSEFRVVGL